MREKANEKETMREGKWKLNNMTYDVQWKREPREVIDKKYIEAIKEMRGQEQYFTLR